jgi:hypothetical protein
MNHIFFHNLSNWLIVLPFSGRWFELLTVVLSKLRLNKQP